MLYDENRDYIYIYIRVLRTEYVRITSCVCVCVCVWRNAPNPILKVSQRFSTLLARLRHSGIRCGVYTRAFIIVRVYIYIFCFSRDFPCRYVLMDFFFFHLVNPPPARTDRRPTDRPVVVAVVAVTVSVSHSALRRTDRRVIHHIHYTGTICL